MSKNKFKYFSRDQIVFLLTISSYFFSLASIIFNSFTSFIILYQILIFIVLVEILRNKISFVNLISSKVLSSRILPSILIFLANILLIGWFTKSGNLDIFSTKDLVIIFLHFTFFSLGFIKLIENQTSSKSTMAIYGAGVAGQQIYEELIADGDHSVLFFIDDEVSKNTSDIKGLRVISRELFINTLYKSVDYVYIAIPTITSAQLNSLVCDLEGLNLKVKKLPSINDIPLKKASLEIMSSIDEADLLGRRAVVPNLDLLCKNITDKVVLVTGAGGSIGSAICLEIIKHAPKEIIIFDISEYGLYKIDHDLKERIELGSEIKIASKIGSIQSLNNVEKLFENNSIDTVFHAAAYKHVPLVESNLLEAFKNNVIGTKNLISVSVKFCVKNFVLISSDKAVRPTNFMGVTKRLCELVCHSFSKNNNGTTISMVRFGNVLGSSGSVVPLFKDQISVGGPLTVTHQDITRYFMTVEEAAELVIQASGLAKGGEIFVLDMGEPIKILDLAKRMISLAGKKPSFEKTKDNADNILIEFTGLRPGEKMFEELFIDANNLKTSHSQIYKASQSFFEIHVLESIFEEILSALENNLSSENIKDIVNRLPVSYEPSK